MNLVTFLLMYKADKARRQITSALTYPKFFSLSIFFVNVKALELHIQSLNIQFLNGTHHFNGTMIVEKSIWF